MFCLKCGARLEEGALFCGNCGNRVNNTVTPPSETVAPKSEQLLQTQMNQQVESSKQNIESEETKKELKEEVQDKNVPISGERIKEIPTEEMKSEETRNSATSNQTSSTKTISFTIDPIKGITNETVSSQEIPNQNDSNQKMPMNNIPNQGMPMNNIPIRGVPNNNAPNQGGPIGNKPGQGMPSRSNKSSNNKVIGIIVGLVIAVVAIAALLAYFFLFGKKTETINLIDYCEVKFSGYDTEGVAKFNFDYDKFELDVLKDEGLNPDEIDSLDALFEQVEEYKVVYDLKDTFEFNLDKKSGLKNGDIVHIEFKIDEEAAKELGYNLVGESKEFKVKGLTSVKEIDPFENLTVEFKGISPKVTVEVKSESKDKFIKNLYFECDKRSGIKKGDKITVTVDCSENYALSAGYRLTQKSKTFECTDVDYYASQIADLPDEKLNKLTEQSLNILNAYFAQNSSHIKASEFTFEGFYLLNAKEGTFAWNGTNRVFTLYSAEVSSLDQSFEPTKVYFPLEFSNIVVKKDGTIEVGRLATNEYDIVGRTDLIFSYYAVAGFTDVKKLFESVVTANIDQYDYTMTDGLKKIHEQQ